MRRLPVAFILITMVIDAMGIGLILPVMPELLEDVNGPGLSRAALWGGILAASFAAMQFLFAPFLGGLSDRYGRRPVLLLSLAVMAVNYLVMAVAGSIWLLLTGRIFAGIASATNSTAMAFMADISAPEDRAKNFGLISACFGIGFVLGPLIGGLLGELGPRAPFIAAAILAAANALFGVFVAPESLAEDKRRAFDWRRANPVGGLAQIGKLTGARPLLIALFLYQVAIMVYPTVWAFFTEFSFGWTPRTVGLSLALVGLFMAIVQGGLMRPAIDRFGASRLAVGSMAISAVSLTLFGLASEGWMIFVLLPLSALGSAGAPALQGILSQSASDDQQGELQGVLSSMGAVAMIVSPFVMSQAFFWFTQETSPIVLPGAPFLLAALMVGAAFVLLLQQLRGQTAGG